MPAQTLIQARRPDVSIRSPRPARVGGLCSFYHLTTNPMSQLLQDMGVAVTADTLPPQPRIPGLGKMEYNRNWNNKLACDCYTSIRLANAGKYKVGRRYGVYLNSKHHHDAILLEVRELTLDQINERLARLDTGYGAKETQDILMKMHRNKFVDWQTQRLSWCLFQKLKPGQ